MFSDSVSTYPYTCPNILRPAYTDIFSNLECQNETFLLRTRVKNGKENLFLIESGL